MADNTIRFEFGNAASGSSGGGGGSRGGGQPSQPFDAAAEARRVLEVEQRRLQVQQEINRLKYGSTTGPAFDPVAQARKAYDADLQQARVKANFNLLKYGREAGALPALPKPVTLQEYDPVGDARKQFRDEQQAEEQKRHYNLMKYGNIEGKTKEQLDAERVKPWQTATSSLRAGISSIAGSGIPGVGGMGQVVGGVASAATNIGAGTAAGGPIRGAVAAAVEALKASVDLAKAGYQKIDAFADKASIYNGGVANAFARGEALETRGDIHRSNIMGPALSDMVEARSRLSNSSENAAAALFRPLIPQFERLFDGLGKMADAAIPFMVTTGESISTFLSLITALYGNGKLADVPELLSKMPERIQKQIAELAKEQNEGAFGLDALMSARAPFYGPPAVAGAAQPLGVPGMMGV